MSFADPNARLFSRQGRLYRGIYPHRVPFFEKLLNDGIVDDLVGKGMLIATERTAMVAEPFGMVLEHRRLPIVSYPFEWSGHMLRDAALLVLDLQRDLLARNLTLQDGHSWNVLWDGVRPVFVDLASIDTFAGGWWLAHQEFCNFFLHPLRFMAAGHPRLARLVMQDMFLGIDGREAALVAKPAPRRVARQRAIRLARAAARLVLPRPVRSMVRGARERVRAVPSLKATLQEMRDEISSMTFPASSDWSGYYDGDYPPFAPDESWTPKQLAVDAVLGALAPKTVLDIGANRGWYSQLAARRGASVVAFDTDEVCANHLYDDVKKDGVQIHPLVMNIADPSPGHGINGRTAAPAVERFGSDVVLALALTHHLVFKRYLNFELIAESLAAFTKRALIVEFMPREDEYVRQWLAPRHDWYTLDNFVRALTPHLPRIEIRPSHPHPRVLVIAQR